MIMSNKNKEQNKGVSEPMVAYSNKGMIQSFGSFEEASEADAKERANLSPEQHLMNVTQMILEMYADELKTPMDKTIQFRKDD